MLVSESSSVFVIQHFKLGHSHSYICKSIKIINTIVVKTVKK